MRLLAAVGLASACLASSSALAADLFESAPAPFETQQQELGSNWYLRGDVGFGRTTQDTVDPAQGMLPTVYQGGYYNSSNNWVNTALFNSAPSGSPIGNDPFVRGNTRSTWTPDFDLGVGYRINDWFRVDATYQFFRGPGLAAVGNEQCPTTLAAAYNNSYAYAGAAPQPTFVGYNYSARPCNGYLNTTQINQVAMGNAYVDLGRWWIFTPYIGAGLGLNANTEKGSLAYYDATTGAAYTGPVVTGGTVPGAPIVQQIGVDQNNLPIYGTLASKNGNTAQGLLNPQNWNRNINQTKFTMAGQIMAGFSTPISQSAVLDVGYRAMSMDLSSGFRNMRQSINVGVRYNIN